ncbi:MAG: hypothetical protein ABI205_12080, partial [Gemmatimonadaceae bacterium]
MNRCPTCGTTYPDDARFCTRDGTRLLTPAGNAAVTPPLGSAAVSESPARTPRATDTPARGVPTTPLTHFNLTGRTLQGR